ncbi:MAG: DUF881 domain-containing protein [Firmicutes bacterium]|nr:DUF881 domain-containing protein [Bacillota bacterium]
MPWGASRWAVGLGALILGMMLAVQVRLQRVVPPPTDTNQLLTLLRTEDARKQALTREVAHLQALLNQRMTAAAAARRLSRELTTAQILAGTVPVHGPGIEVQWSNGTAPPGYQLTDIDLLLMVNELRAAGAEAISINGQRITALSEIRQAANYIVINDTQEDPPFTIDAIGPPKTLRDALTLPGGLVSVSQQEGRSITVSLRSMLTIPATTAPSLSYAKAGPS